MNWIKKLIPAKIEIRSLYWVNIQKEMEEDLAVIFNNIDGDNYLDAKSLISQFRLKWDGRKYPNWIWNTHAEISRAQAMIDFLSAPLVD